MSTETPTPTPKGAPMSPRPHLFGTPPPPRDPSSPLPTSSLQDGQEFPTRILPSDLLTMEDYRRIRYEATKKSLIGSLIGGVGSAVAVRQFWPKRPTPNALVLVGFGAGILTGVYSSVSYLRSEISVWREKADQLSLPTSEDGSPLLFDRHDSRREDMAQRLGETVSLPEPPTVTSTPHTIDRGKWDNLGQGKQDQLRDPFFRPGVPRTGA